MMRRLSLTNSALKLTLLAISFVLLLPVTARNQQPFAKQGELLTIISSLDHAFFEAYNKCELSKIESLFTSDIEFYHEKARPTDESAKRNGGFLEKPLWR